MIKQNPPPTHTHTHTRKKKERQNPFYFLGKWGKGKKNVMSTGKTMIFQTGKTMITDNPTKGERANDLTLECPLLYMGGL